MSPEQDATSNTLDELSSSVAQGRSEESASGTPPEKKRRRWLRWSFLFLVLVALFFVARHYQLEEAIKSGAFAKWMQAQGLLGAFVFAIVFSIGLLVQVPGWVFVTASHVAYGPWLGYIVCYLGAIAAVSVSFGIFRYTGGHALTKIKWKWAQTVLARLETHPVTVVTVLRLLLVVSPPINIALALSPLRFRSYLIGSAIGLIVPIAVMMFLADWILSFFSWG